MAHDSYAALRIKNYRWFIVSLLTMTISSQIQAVVVAWQIYDITRDPLSLGLMGLAEALPFIGFSLYAGHVADRINRRVVSLASIALLLGCSLTLLVYNLVPGFLGKHGAMPFYAVIFVSGIARSFLQPARQALGAELVDRSLYANAVAWRSSTWQFGRRRRAGARRVDLRIRLAARRVRRRRDHDGRRADHVLVDRLRARRPVS